MMIGLLQNDYVNYFYSRAKLSAPSPLPTTTIISARCSSAKFDIIDKNSSIIVRVSAGVATYNNPQLKTMLFISYEDYMNSLPQNLTRKVARADYLGYSIDSNDLFVINELSESGKASTKQADARTQLQVTLIHLLNVPAIERFILQFDRKECYFSNRSRSVPQSPNSVAATFALGSTLLPKGRIPLNAQQITNRGFTAWETDQIDV